MTKTRYKLLLRKAIHKSKVERWIPRSKTPFIDVPDCELCNLATKLADSSIVLKGKHRCNLCLFPGNLRGQVNDCSSGWTEWRCSETEEELKAAALTIIAELDAIDIDAWVEKLFKKGYLKRSQPRCPTLKPK